MMVQRLTISFGALVIWAGMTVYGSILINGGTADLADTVNQGPSWPILLAGLFILSVTLVMGWQADTGLRRMQHPRAIWLAWFPMLYIVGILALAVTMGLPTTEVLLWLALNCLLIGFSEELMFRGVLLEGFRAHFPIWPAVIITTVIFGAVHSLNILTTGYVVQPLIQSVAAAMSGLMFMALRLRTGALWPAMLLHALWNFAIFALALSPKANVNPNDAPTSALMILLLPILFILPNALYALWMMRHIRRDIVQSTCASDEIGLGNSVRPR